MHNSLPYSHDTATRFAAGLYVHIPFCRFACHYCDFAKTARWDTTDFAPYIKALSHHLAAWHEARPFSARTLHLGGGTPGLLTHEWHPFFTTLQKLDLNPGEVAIEVNPENVTPEALRVWQECGINRLSIGIQSFHPQALQFLTRPHDAVALHEALEEARSRFTNVSIDLIYGWPGQTLDDLLSDLEVLERLSIPHVSLYNLTYEPKTPIGRAMHRGKLATLPEETQEALYKAACKQLRAYGFDHYECSNWARPGFASEHNMTYWRDQYFIGLGAGAWGYHPSLAAIHGPRGFRYRYNPAYKTYITSQALDPKEMNIDVLTQESWALDLIGAQLRFSEGLDLEALQRQGWNWKPTPTIEEGLATGKLHIEAKRLKMAEAEWLRENAWCQEVVASLTMVRT
jgi:oxygen-independent coproporphyrinogen-3 oxidase